MSFTLACITMCLMITLVRCQHVKFQLSSAHLQLFTLVQVKKHPFCDRMADHGPPVENLHWEHFFRRVSPPYSASLTSKKKNLTSLRDEGLRFNNFLIRTRGTSSPSTLTDEGEMGVITPGTDEDTAKKTHRKNNKNPQHLPISSRDKIQRHHWKSDDPLLITIFSSSLSTLFPTFLVISGFSHPSCIQLFFLHILTQPTTEKMLFMWSFVLSTDFHLLQAVSPFCPNALTPLCVSHWLNPCRPAESPTRAPLPCIDPDVCQGWWPDTAKRSRPTLANPTLAIVIRPTLANPTLAKPTLTKPTLAKPTLANVKVLVVCKDFGFSELIVWVF